MSRKKSADQDPQEDPIRTAGGMEAAASSQAEEENHDPKPAATGDATALADQESRRMQPQGAAPAQSSREGEVPGVRKKAASLISARQEKERSGPVVQGDETPFQGEAVKEVPAVEANGKIPFGQPAAKARSGLRTAGTRATQSIPVPPGAGETPKDIDLIKDQPGKRKAAEAIDLIPNMAGLQRQLTNRKWPRREQVRLEEMLKFAPAPGLPPSSPNPLDARQEQVQSPWNPQKQILRVSLHAKDAPIPARGPANLVFAIDVSTSMAGPNRLPLVQEGVRRLVDRLRPDDIISVVTYAGKADLALSAQPAAWSGEVRRCLAGLEATGLTNGSAGLKLAYETAHDNWIEAGINVVVLCTDGNFNLGTTDETALAAMAAAQAKNGVRLSVFGFGRTDRNDLRLELLATNGGGRSCYVNTEDEAERQLFGQIDGLFAPVARDVRLQVEFNPAQVEDFRRMGDGADQETDGAVAALLPGRNVTAMFELTPRSGVEHPGAVGRLQLGYILPGSGEHRQETAGLSGAGKEMAQTSLEFRFAIAMAEFGRILRNGQPADTAELDRLDAWVRENLPNDTGGYRTELLQNLELARAVVQSQAVEPEAR